MVSRPLSSTIGSPIVVLSGLASPIVVWIIGGGGRVVDNLGVGVDGCLVKGCDGGTVRA